MKIFNLLLVAILITCGTTRVAFAEEDESDWALVGATDQAVIFFDKPTLQKAGENKYFVGLRYELTKAGKREYIKLLSSVTKNAEEVKEIQTMLAPLTYIIHLVELDVQSRTMIVKTVIHFDDEDNAFYGYDEENNVVEVIEPRTVNEEILNAVVNYANSVSAHNPATP